MTPIHRNPTTGELTGETITLADLLTAGPTFIPCTPYGAKVFDLTDGVMRDCTVNGFNVRLYEKEPPPGAMSVQVDASRWLLFQRNIAQ